MRAAALLVLAWSAALACQAQAQSAREADRAALAAANGGALQAPNAARFERARQVYEFFPGALYALSASAGRVSAVLLEPGEIITAIAAGDTSRWMLSEAETEAGARAVLLVKPLEDDIRTNFIIVTDRRLYLIDASAGSSSAAFAAELSWSYPAQPHEIPQPPVALNTGYSIRVTRGPRPIWTPLSVGDDGRRTFIDFPPEVAADQLPPLFVITSEGAELVNYRVDGTRYVVERRFERAELRLGARAPTIVRIERVGPDEPRPPRRRRR